MRNFRVFTSYSPLTAIGTKSREKFHLELLKYTSEVPQNGFKKKPVLNRT